MSRIKNFDQVIEKVKEHLLDYLEEQEINTKVNFNCIHSEHEDTVASCGVMRQSDFQKWHCFGCNEFGDIFDACAHLEGKPTNGPEYIKETVLYLAEKYGIEVQIEEPTEEEKYRIETFNAYKKAAHYIATNIPVKVIQEMERTEWNIEGAVSRLIGSVESFKIYKEYMKAQGFSVSFLESIDLLNPKIFDENNMIFTTCDEYGRPCGFSARNLDWTKENSKEVSKYFNTATRCPIYEKSKRLYNIHNAKKCDGTLYTFEGHRDVETAIQHGLLKVVGVGGTSFTDYHVIELSRMGITDITLCMDGDTRGQESLDRILEKFTSHKEFTVHVVSIPEELDPDDYLRKYGADRFRNLKRWTAFEWKLNSYDDRIDTVLIRKEVIPIIASEISPMIREEMAKILSDRVGITIDAIKSEVEQVLDESEAKRSKERGLVLQTLSTDIKICPNDWRISLNRALQNLEILSETYNEDTFSAASYLKDLDVIQDDEQNLANVEQTYDMPDWREFTEALFGEWEETLNVLGGAANTGKTGFMASMANQLAKSEDEDILVLFHTIDDTVRQFTTRLVCQYAQELMPNITLNMIKKPNRFPEARQINRARQYGYDKVKRLVATHKLLVKGGEVKGGNTLAFGHDMIKYYKKMYPDKKIIYFLDNFHRLRDFANLDERLRFKKLSNATKDIAKKEKIPIWATMEYNKSVGEERPNNNSIAESIAMEYDANTIIHIYNELHSKRDRAETFFTRTDCNGQTFKAPRIELIFGKNKITDFKGSVFFDFVTDQSRYVPVPFRIVKAERERVRQQLLELRQNRYAGGSSAA